MENSETPSYFAKVRNSSLLQQWSNLSPEEAIHKEVDGISGATESSVAIIQSVHKAMEYAKEHSADKPASAFSFDWILFLGLLAGIALCTLIISYLSKRPKEQTMHYALNTFNLALVIVVTALSHPTETQST
ncbi:MAG: FMN-binding protein [Bacteroides cellulosilyticus]